jgi:hypothetical protein
MQAIETRFIGPTDYRGARIKATAGGGATLTIAYDYEGNEHRKAAEALRDKLGWTGELIEGSTTRGNVYVFAPEVTP